MAHSLVRSQTPEEREYARYLAEVETRKRQASELQTELKSLTLTLGRFASEYHARVGALFVDLDRTRLTIDEYERRIALLKIDPAADPDRIERDIRQEFAGRREEVYEEEEETRRYEQAFQREQDRPQLDSETAEEVRRLYRELARRHHPDLARTEEERRQCEPLMQRVNAAMYERDLEALRALAREAEAADPAFEARSIGEKLVWAIREVARLAEVIIGLETELVATWVSETHQLWSRQEAGEQVIEALEADLTEELAQRRDRLSDLIATYRHLADRRTG